MAGEMTPLDLENFGDFDIRVGVSEGLDITNPKAYSDTSADIAYRKAAEDTHNDFVEEELAVMDHSIAVIISGARQDPRRTLDILGGEVKCREMLGDIPTQWLVRQCVEQSV